MNNDDIFSLPLEEAGFSVIDVETTGLSPRYNNIIEVGIVKVSGLKIIDSYETLVNPGRMIPYYITNVTGINSDDIYDAPFFEDIAGNIINFISEDILTAHNLSFDKSFLKRELLLAGHHLHNFSLCTLKLSARLYPYLKRKSLKSICNHLNLHNKREHRALPDAEVTAKALIKIIKELQEKENIKTVSDLINYQFIPKEVKKKGRIKKKLGEDIASLPAAPGIYYFLNSKEEVIYIGKAKSLRDRVKSYFSPTAPRKAKKIVKQASRLKIEITNSELTALLSEAESIKIINPKHNTQLKQYGNKYFLKITSTQDFPAMEITNKFDFDGNDYFGLFLTKRKALSLYEMLNRTFAIRECNDDTLKKEKACFLAEIERCTAPCINHDKVIYNEELEKVYEFLYGKNQFALNRLLNKMKDYSSKLKFEKAGEVKQLIDVILSQTHKSSILAEPVNSANVLFEINEGYLRDYILMIGGKIYIKKYALEKRDSFEIALDDYFENTLNFKIMPEDEDLEKMKITLNWLVKNRNKVRVFYLKNYSSKTELYSKLTHYGNNDSLPVESSFDIKNFINDKIENEVGV